jgi:alcohol dehydrogenase class IV
MSDEAASMAAIQAIRDLSARVGIPSGFSKLGVTKEDIEGWLDKALADPARRATHAPQAATKSASSTWRHYDPQGLCDAG